MVLAKRVFQVVCKRRLAGFGSGHEPIKQRLDGGSAAQRRPRPKSHYIGRETGLWLSELKPAKSKIKRKPLTVCYRQSWVSLYFYILGLGPNAKAHIMRASEFLSSSICGQSRVGLSRNCGLFWVALLCTRPPLTNWVSFK